MKNEKMVEAARVELASANAAEKALRAYPAFNVRLRRPRGQGMRALAAFDVASGRLRRAPDA